MGTINFVIIMLCCMIIALAGFVYEVYKQNKKKLK